MRVRGLDTNGDWLFGKGRNDYKRDIQAVIQNIGTRLQSFLGDCFFDTGAGIDWFNLLGQRSTLPLQLAIAAVILNTAGVTGLIELAVSLSETSRRVTITYAVNTVYSTASGVFNFDIEVAA